VPVRVLTHAGIHANPSSCGQSVREPARYLFSNCRPFVCPEPVLTNHLHFTTDMKTQRQNGRYYGFFLLLQKPRSLTAVASHCAIRKSSSFLTVRKTPSFGPPVYTKKII
jgi:hypothetical protein